MRRDSRRSGRRHSRSASVAAARLSRQDEADSRTLQPQRIDRRSRRLALDRGSARRNSPPTRPCIENGVFPGTNKLSWSTSKNSVLSANLRSVELFCGSLRDWPDALLAIERARLRATCNFRSGHLVISTEPHSLAKPHRIRPAAFDEEVSVKLRTLFWAVPGLVGSAARETPHRSRAAAELLSRVEYRLIFPLVARRN